MAADNETYTAEQYDENYPDGIEQSYWNRARNRIICAALGAPLGTVLDVGCGRGIVVDYLRAQGVDCWGCERGEPRPIHPRIAPYLLLGRDTSQLEPAFAATVHTVLLLDVLEHLDDPAALLRDCRARFTRAKRFVITLPAREELWTNYDDHFGHRRRYDRVAARDLLACLSPAHIHMRYFFHSLYLPLRAMAAFGRRRTVNVQAPKGWLLPVHSLLSQGLRLESAALPGWLPGTSLLAVAELG